MSDDRGNDNDSYSSIETHSTQRSGGAAEADAASTESQSVKDPNMVLTDTERRWALELKRAVLENEDLMPL